VYFVQYQMQVFLTSSSPKWNQKKVVGGVFIAFFRRRWVRNHRTGGTALSLPEIRASIPYQAQNAQNACYASPDQNSSDAILACFKRRR
jgi:hypothetical protein